VDYTSRGKNTYISNTGDTDSLEFPAVKFFYCGLEIRSGLELNKASDLLVIEMLSEQERYRPFAIPVSTSLGVNHVKAGLTGEVFKVLNPDPCKSSSRYCCANAKVVSGSCLQIVARETVPELRGTFVLWFIAFLCKVIAVQL
jgi:hypothetical protein